MEWWGSLRTHALTARMMAALLTDNVGLPHAISDRPPCLHIPRRDSVATADVVSTQHRVATAYILCNLPNPLYPTEKSHDPSRGAERNKFLCRAMPRTWQPQRPTGIALPQRKAHDTFRSFQYGKHHLCISCLYELTVLSIATLC
jgi:hypothetical protein